MKKIWLLIVAIMCLAFIGCSKDSADAPKEPTLMDIDLSKEGSLYGKWWVGEKMNSDGEFEYATASEIWEINPDRTFIRHKGVYQYEYTYTYNNCILKAYRYTDLFGEYMDEYRFSKHNEYRLKVERRRIENGEETYRETFHILKALY